MINIARDGCWCYIAVYRLLNHSYLQSIGVEFLPGYADPYKGRLVMLCWCSMSITLNVDVWSAQWNVRQIADGNKLPVKWDYRYVHMQSENFSFSTVCPYFTSVATAGNVTGRVASTVSHVLATQLFNYQVVLSLTSCGKSGIQVPFWCCDYSGLVWLGIWNSR